MITKLLSSELWCRVVWYIYIDAVNERAASINLLLWGRKQVTLERLDLYQTTCHDVLEEISLYQGGDCSAARASVL